MSKPSTILLLFPDNSINGKQHWLWRAVDTDGNVLDILLQRHRDKAAATGNVCLPNACIDELQLDKRI